MRELLSDEDLGKALGELRDWARREGALVRTVELETFPQAIEVVTRVAVIAESDDHHPDIDIRWRTLTFRCSTHSAGGITAKDVALANKIDGEIAAVRT
jgi:4a-hydroxytetrahydrobiopterin dehydratase